MSDAEHQPDMSPEIVDLRRRLDRQAEEENTAAKKEMAARADYKIQIWFRRNRSLWGLNDYTLSFWESGKRLHGGGDELMRICKRLPGAPKPRRPDVLAVSDMKAANAGGCGKLIPGGLVSLGRVQCPHCQMLHVSEHIATSIFNRTDMQRASEILAYWWHQLDGRAMLYAKYSPDDPRTLAMADLHGFKMASERKGLTVYTLERIRQDISTGRSIESAFKAFVTA